MRNFLPDETRELVLHSLSHLLVALVFITCAVVLDVVEHWLAAKKISEWLLVGIQLLARFLFFTEGIAICFVTAMTGFALVCDIGKKMVGSLKK